jgi:hypothetical protein
MFRRLVIGVALALLVLLPVTASAQPKPPAPAAPPAQMQAAGDGLALDKIVAIGVGVLVGVLAGEAIGGADAITLIAGVAGGYVGAWWYDSGATVRANLRQPTAVAAAWRPSELALAR